MNAIKILCLEKPPKSLIVDSLGVLIPLLKQENQPKTGLPELVLSGMERVEHWDSFEKEQLLQIQSNAYKFALESGLYWDGKKSTDEALKYYVQALEIGVPLSKHDQNLKKQLMQIMSRAEELKAQSHKTKSQTHSLPTSSLTKYEIIVLKSSSRINGRLFVPFLEEDLQDRFNMLEGKFKDPDGLLPLSKTQKQYFYSWRRPSDFMGLRKPQIISLISALSITQNVVTDCSFISSLCVALHYEKRFKKPLVSNLIYPHNSKGQSIYNDSGKYMVVLHYNGIPRKVVIDDRLPTTSSGQLLCAQSEHGDLFVSLIEKAYMKLHGGYDFPGSNSGVDMYTLTGWIPDDLSIKSKVKKFDKAAAWKRLLIGHETGSSVATISTGDDPSVSLHGLEDTHAYCILEVKEVLGKKFVLIKNPWSKRRWTGRYSPGDVNWTPELLKALQYDVTRALYEDNGVFYMEWEDCCQFFSVIHLSFNPKALFKFYNTVHGAWLQKDSPLCQIDRYSYEHNPQYRLTCHGAGNIWIVLTKHVTQVTKKTSDFMTIHVFEGSNRIMYKTKPVLEGTYVNNMHHRLCLTVPKPGSYIVVVSQYEKIETIRFSISSYGDVKHELQRILPVPPNGEQFSLKSKWQGKSAAGNHSNYHGYTSNPQFRFRLVRPTNLRLTLECKNPELQINAMILDSGHQVDESDRFNGMATVQAVKATTGSYINCFTSWEGKLSPGRYHIICATFNAGEEDDFVLKVTTSQRGIAKLDPV